MVSPVARSLYRLGRVAFADDIDAAGKTICDDTVRHHRRYTRRLHDRADRILHPEVAIPNPVVGLRTETG
ncbi:hypothetical protein ASF57_03075 [Methylobacterium sp. Leaf117]|nr:hypothetical protein ASF57_03075 [Methylobacterium sp. Leaf117]